MDLNVLGNYNNSICTARQSFVNCCPALVLFGRISRGIPKMEGDWMGWDGGLEKSLPRSGEFFNIISVSVFVFN